MLHPSIMGWMTRLARALQDRADDTVVATSSSSVVITLPHTGIAIQVPTDSHVMRVYLRSGRMRALYCVRPTGDPVRYAEQLLAEVRA